MFLFENKNLKNEYNYTHIKKWSEFISFLHLDKSWKLIYLFNNFYSLGYIYKTLYSFLFFGGLLRHFSGWVEMFLLRVNPFNLRM